MREPDFNALATRLLKNGISPRHAHRTVNELRDHYDDLVDAAVDEGANSKNARLSAANELGTMDDFVGEMASFVGIANRTALVRWGASLLAAGLVTALLLLTMQLSIILG